MHLAHQVVVAQHSSHAQCQAQRNAHRQPFGHTHHNQRDGKHHRGEHIFNKLKQIPRVVDNEIGEHPTHKQQRCSPIAKPRNGFAQTLKLLHKRCFHTVVDLRSRVHLAIFGGIAHASHLHGAMSINHRGATKQLVGGIGGFVVEILFAMRLAHHWLACEGALVDAQRAACHQHTIGWHFFARFEHHHIANHQLAPQQVAHLAVAHHLNADLVVDLVE